MYYVINIRSAYSVGKRCKIWLKSSRLAVFEVFIHSAFYYYDFLQLNYFGGRSNLKSVQMSIQKEIVSPLTALKIEIIGKNKQNKQSITISNYAADYKNQKVVYLAQFEQSNIYTNIKS